MLDQIRKYPPIDVLSIAIVGLVARVGYWLYAGTRTGGDTQTYLSTCDVWFTQPWLLPRLINTGFTLPFCILTEGLGLPWSGWVAIQILLSVVACLLIYATAVDYLGRSGGLAAGFTMALFWDSFQWDVYILTDSVFVFTVALAIWAVSLRYRSQTRRTFWLAWFSLALMSVTRAHGFPIAAGWLLLDFLPRGHRYRPNLIPNPLLGIAVMVIGGVLILSQYFEFVTATVFQWYADGLIVWDEPSLRYPYELSDPSSPIAFLLFNLHHILAISLLRVVLFFNVYMPRWSTPHQILRLGTLAPVFLASFWAVVSMVRSKSKFLRLWVLPLGMLLAVIAVTHVDWDWRYRAPAAPMFSLLVGYAVYRLRELPAVQNMISKMDARS